MFAAMSILFLVGFFVSYYFEARGNPNFNQHGVTQAAAKQAAPSKPAATWKARKCASASRTRRSLRRSRPMLHVARSTRCTTRITPLGGMIPLLNIMLGEVIFGGVGAGMYGMLVMIVLTVFIAGLMVGPHA